MTQPRAFLVLAANTAWVYALADSLTECAAVTAMRFYDWINYLRLRPAWPPSSSDLRRVMRAMPPGYAGKLEPLLRPVLSAMIRHEGDLLRRRTGDEAAFVICPFPYLAPWVRDIPDDRLIYYSLDEYAFYDPSRASTIHRLEGELVSRARLTVCLSVHQAGVLRARHPADADRIKHFPLGVVADFLNPDPAALPEPHTVGYIGTLTNRVDWRLVGEVAELCPDARFLFHGDLAQAGAAETDPEWRSIRERALALPNVRYLGNLPQADVARYYWKYAINWMPYDTSNGFNIAACPTKIMDAFASGRPFVSTDLPECRLYEDRLHIVQGAAQAADCMRRILVGRTAHDPIAQTAFAATQTWPHRATELMRLIQS